MNKSKFTFLILLLLTILSGCAAKMAHPDTPLGNLRTEIDQLLNDPAFASATWGIYIEAPDKREVLYRHNEDKLLIPSSNIKLFTTAAALVRFGPNFTYKTSARSG